MWDLLLFSVFLYYQNELFFRGWYKKAHRSLPANRGTFRVELIIEERKTECLEC